jgi:hypothetical protein
MKRNILFCLIAICFFSKAFSQNTPDSLNSKVNGIINIYPLQLVSGELRTSYEKPIKHNISLELGLGFIYGVNYSEILGYDFSGFSFSLPSLEAVNGMAIRYSMKFYLLKAKNHDGLFISPLILGKYFYNGNVSKSYPALTENIYTMGFQALIGYKILGESNLSFEIYGGFGIRKIFDKFDWHNTGNPDNNSGTEIYINKTPQLGFSLGYKLFKK